MTNDTGVEVWRGGVNVWECDEMGHMNVRFYVTRAMQGLVGLAAELGMPEAFSPDADSTLLVREQHIRFLREARPPAPMHMTGSVVEMGETDARLLLVLTHSTTGEPAATFQTVVSHVTPRDGRPFPWTRRIRERAERLTAPVPDYAAARSIALEPFETTASLARADALDLVTISAGAVLQQDCDVFGRMGLDGFIGRVSDGIPRLVSRLRGAVVEHAETRPARVGGAVLEYRLAYLDWPRAGDRVVIRSGLAGVDSRTQRMVHWMLDPNTGRPWGVSEAVAITLDLDARKIVPISEAAQAAMRGMITPGLAL
ncbi:thioesterase family protein [Phenylobacterium montanum]|uniref:Thioesterase family protein n=1 Tax=Phenylobacterium montanum TaxID=2823693 RepID=A0A975FZ74_9CAUL|nr:thioesterase family protein [Caulobacter sp. S6]QUD87637.1 thioesterase family protein [Caulobacter sp. S6]